jgi:hypothetical protein
MYGSRSLALVAGLMAMLMSGSADAASLKLGKIGVGGTGCPAGSVSGALSSSSLSLSFRRYDASAGGARSFDRKACSLAIPVVVPPGLSIAIVGVQYRGYNRLSAGSATLSTEIFYAGGTGPVIKRTFSGPASGPFKASLSASSPAWSPCGTPLTLRINSSIKVETAGGKTASMSVRSQDVSSALVYLIKTRAC